MSDRMRPIPIGKLLDGIFSEYFSSGAALTSAKSKTRSLSFGSKSERRQKRETLCFVAFYAQVLGKMP